MKHIIVKKTKHGIHKSIKSVNLSVTTSGKTMLSPGTKTVHSPVFVRVGDTVMAYGKYKAKKSTEKATNFIKYDGPDVDIFVDKNLNAQTFVNGKEIDVTGIKDGETLAVIPFNDLPAEDQKEIIKEAMKIAKELQESKLRLENQRCHECGVYPGEKHLAWCKENRVTMTGNEYLRSINNPHHKRDLIFAVWLIAAVVYLLIILF